MATVQSRPCDPVGPGLWAGTTVAEATAMRVVLIVLALSSAAHAGGESAVAEARQRYQRGTRLYDLNEWQAALVEFERAYRVKADAALLFNAAQCHRQLGQY